MSHTTLKTVSPSGEVKSYDTLSNAWGWAPRIWDALYERYLPGETWLRSEGRNDKLWELVFDHRVQAQERDALRLTFDHSWVRAEDLPLVADILVWFETEHAAPKRVSHLDRIAHRLEAWPDGCGLAFYGTSVSEDPWRVQLDCETCGHPLDDEERAVNVITDGIDPIELLTPRKAAGHATGEGASS